MKKDNKASLAVEIVTKNGAVLCSLVIKSIIEGLKVVHNLEWENNELNNAELKDILFEFGGFDYSTFSEVYAYNLEFFGSWINDASFKKCRIIDVLFYEPMMFGCVFQDCSFENVAFRGANLAESLFDNCTFQNCKFTSDNINHFTDLTDAKFINCSVMGTVFDDIDINENTVLPKIGKQ